MNSECSVEPADWHCLARIFTDATCINELNRHPLKAKTESGSSPFLFLIGLLEEWSKPSVEPLYLFNLYRCYGNKNCRQNRLKIEKIAFLDQI